MTIWLDKINVWLQRQVDVPQHPLEPDEMDRDAALLRTMAVFTVVLLVVSTLIARVVLSRGDAWLALLLGDV